MTKLQFLIVPLRLSISPKSCLFFLFCFVFFTFCFYLFICLFVWFIYLFQHMDIKNMTWFIHVIQCLKKAYIRKKMTHECRFWTCHCDHNILELFWNFVKFFLHKWNGVWLLVKISESGLQSFCRFHCRFQKWHSFMLSLFCNKKMVF